MLSEELDQLLRLGPGVVHPEGFPDNGSLLLVDDDVLLVVHRVADRQRRPTILSLFRGLPHASDDLLPEVCGVILGQAFQNALQDDPLRTLRDRLLSIQQTDARLFQLHFTEGDVLPVTPEAVDLPDDHALEAVLLRVVQHPLELIPADDALP
nr:hypothetical protein [Provencibacterium massiliense]